jgi:putative ABC transport system permease protein
LTAVGVGLLPALFSRRTDVVRSLRGGQRGGIDEGARLRAGLLLVQATLAVVLLIGAALFVRSLDAVRSLPMGYEPDRVLLINRIIRGPAFTADAQRSLRESLLNTAQSLPGVESAAWMSSAPFVSTSWTALFVEGIESADRLGVFTYQATTPGYFRTMGTRIVRGRGLTAEDRGGAPPVGVVSESMARTLWPGQDAIGKCFRMREHTAPCVTVVGLAEDMVQRDLVSGTRYHYYVSIDQYTRTWGNGLLLRLRGDPGREAETIRAALQRVMPGESYLVARPLADVIAAQQRPWQLGAALFVVFGVLAVVVAAIGLYGAAAYSVARRTHEFGVRVALGADRARLIRLVVGQSLRLTGGGILIGLMMSAAAGRWIAPLLFRQSPHDPFVYGSVGALVLAIAMLASALPAHRAATIDPNTALKTE